MSVLVVGSMAYDDIETPFDKRLNTLGGSATYFSTAASYFTPVNLVAVVGDDFNHDDISFLKDKKIDLSGLTTEPGLTFRWGGRYLEDMIERETLFTKLGVFEKFNPVLPVHFQNSEYIFLANIQPDLQYNVMQQVRQPKFVAMDTMNYWITGTLPELKKTIGLVDCLVINDSEVRLLSNKNNIFQGVKVIQDMGPRTLIIKKGEHGSILIHGDSYFSCPAMPVENFFDPTGAGDTFAGGFMGYLAFAGEISPTTLRRAIIMGTVMAAFCVQDFGTDKIKSITNKDISQSVSRLLDIITIEEDNFWIKR